MTVWILEGWFGDDEWIEGVYATKESAEAECKRLWVDRTSDNAPEWCQRLCKFDYYEMEVQ